MKRKNDELMLFSGTANMPLAKKVAKYLKRPLNRIDIKHFPDGETFCQVQEGVRGRDVFVIQSGSPTPNEAYMELFVIMDALKRGSAARITAVIPYYGYARQDRKDQPRVPITARLVANLLEAAGADRVLTMDLHASQIQGFFDIPVDNLYGAPLFARHFSQRFGKGNEDFMVVSPDVGSVSRARSFALKMELNMAIVDKRREKANQSEVMNIIGSVEGKNVILLDDMVDTAGSLCGAAKALVEIGGAKTAYGYSRKLGTDLAIVAKQRTGDSDVDAFSIVGDVNGREVVMIDDMTATGGTLSAAAKILKSHGAKSVHAFVSHFPLTPKGIERLQGESQLDELVVTDSIALHDGFDVKSLPFKFTVLSVAPLIGEAIRRIHEDRSVNSLFKEPSSH